SITTAPVAVLIHKGFDQPGPIPITLLPVPGQTLEGQSQGMAGQVLDRDVGPDQKSTIINHPVQIFGAHLVAPSDPLVAGTQTAGGGAESNDTQNRLGATDEIPQLTAAQVCSQRVKTLQQLSALARDSTVAAADQNQLHRSNLSKAAPDRRKGLEPSFGGAALGPGGKGLRGRQLDQPAPLQLLQRDPSGGGLRFARRTLPIQPLAELTRQSPSRQIAAAPVQALNDCWTEFSPTNDHAGENAAKKRRCPAEKLWDTLSLRREERDGVRRGVFRSDPLQEPPGRARGPLRAAWA